MSRLKANEIDVAIALTESLIAGIAKQTAEFKLVGTYVTSPLNWAVIVGKDSKYQKLEDLRGEKIGVSRIGRCVRSGHTSHSSDARSVGPGAFESYSHSFPPQWKSGHGELHGSSRRLDRQGRQGRADPV
jgi:hypothetical protein